MKTVIAFLLLTTAAQAQVIEVRPGVGHGTGIREASPAPWYSGPPMQAETKPDAAVYVIRGEVKRNACGSNRFELLNPDRGEASCYGQ